MALILLLVPILAGCLSYGSYEWVAYSSDEGYFVVLSARTDGNKAYVAGWESEFVGPCENLVLDGLRNHGFKATRCEIIGRPSMNQGGMLNMVFAAGDEAFLSKAATDGTELFHNAVYKSQVVCKVSGKLSAGRD